MSKIVIALGGNALMESEVDFKKAIIGSPGLGTSSHLLFRMFVEKDADLRPMEEATPYQHQKV